jgi:3-deoxy-D-manno-octulosonic acid (KDO) 8-phosphate synthase
MRIGNIPVGDGAPLVLLSGLNVIENEADTVETARTIQARSARPACPS